MVHPQVIHHFKTFSPFLWYKLLLNIPYSIRSDPLYLEEPLPHYLESMFHGLNFIFESITVPLSLNYLENLDAHTTHSIQHDSRADIESKLLTKQLEEAINTYNRSMESSTNTEEKLMCIAACIQALALEHSYYADERKAQLLLLLLKLLLENDLTPALLSSIDDFDTLSVDTLIKAQKNFKFGCLIDEDPPKGIILYLENNPFLAEVIALQIAGSISTWYDIEPVAKDIFLSIILKILADKKSFTFLKLRQLIQEISDCSHKAVISLAPVTLDLKLFRDHLQHKNLLPPESSLLHSVLDSIFGFFYEPSQPIACSHTVASTPSMPNAQEKNH